MHAEHTARFEAVGADRLIHSVDEWTIMVPHRGAPQGAPAGREWFLDGEPVELVDERRGEYRVMATGVRLRRLPITD
jgi:hypothetical protein